MSIEAIVNEFSAVAANPKGQLKAYKDAGKKCIGVMPYYAPEELVYAAGMMPFGMWGSNDKTEQRSKEYCATFYCTIAQLDLEMLLDGTMDLLDGVITPTICDTLRPMSQNIRVAMSEKLPCIFLAHPQNRFADWGKQFCLDQYNNVKAGLEKIAGHEIKSEDIAAAIKVYNKSRAARREFVKLASDHCDVIDPIMRSAVLKAAWFMDKAEYTEKLEALNAEIAALPEAKWNGVKVVTSGIICDNPTLLKIFKDNNVAIAADDVAHESRAFRTDASEEGDPMMALVEQFTNTDYDVLLYDPQSSKNRRGEFVANMVKESGAQGLVLFMQQFCDPEEMEFPYLKKALDAAGIPFIKLGIDQQMRAACGDNLQGFEAVFLVRQAQQRPCVPLGEVMLAQKAHTVGRQAQQPQLVGNSGLGFSQPFRRLLPKVQHLLGIGAERPALAGKRHAAAAVKQCLSQFLLELKYALAHGGLGDNKPLRTAGEILRFRQSKKGFKLFRVHGRSLRFLYGIEMIRIIRFIYCTKRGRIVNRNTCGTKERIPCC